MGVGPGGRVWTLRKKWRGSDGRGGGGGGGGGVNNLNFWRGFTRKK